VLGSVMAQDLAQVWAVALGSTWEPA
jgi:hypothetical protein